MSRCLTEFIGTFFLVLTIGLTVTRGTPMAPVAVGLVLTALVYMGAHVSGAHYNPAASLGLFLLGQLRAATMLVYWLSQLAGAVAAAATVAALAGETFAPGPGPGVGNAAALAAEFLFTFALMLVIANVAVSPATRGNGYFGLAIGFIVGAGAFAVGPVSSAAFNPAVGIGPTLVHAGSGNGGWDALWIYLAGPMAGAALAAGVFRLQAR